MNCSKNWLTASLMKSKALTAFAWTSPANHPAQLSGSEESVRSADVCGGSRLRSAAEPAAATREVTNYLIRSRAVQRAEGLPTTQKRQKRLPQSKTLPRDA